MINEKPRSDMVARLYRLRKRLARLQAEEREVLTALQADPGSAYPGEKARTGQAPPVMALFRTYARTHVRIKTAEFCPWVRRFRPDLSHAIIRNVLSQEAMRGRLRRVERGVYAIGGGA